MGGEGGYVPAPVEFLQGIRKICDENGVRPDILIFAKGIANGFPLSGIASTYDLMSQQKPGTMGGTYAGNAVACAAGKAVINVFHEENILENVKMRSKQLFSFLEDLKETPEGS